MKIILDIKNKIIQPLEGDYFKLLEGVMNSHRFSEYTIGQPVLSINDNERQFYENGFNGQSIDDYCDCEKCVSGRKVVTMDMLNNVLNGFSSEMLDVMHGMTAPDTIDVWHNGMEVEALIEHTKETKKGNIKIRKRFKYLYK